MLETIPCTKLISEMSSRRISIFRTHNHAFRTSTQPLRSFSITIRPRAEVDTPKPKRPPPPPAEHVPSVKQVADYAARVNSMSMGGAFKSIAEPYRAYGATEALYGECAHQADYSVPNKLRTPPEPAPKNDAGEDIGQGEGSWFAPRSQGGLELPVTFISWAQIMYLHLYVLTVRMRRFPAENVRIWDQHLMDHFYYAAEDKMEKWHGMAARGVRNKNLKDLWLQWRGALLSYDEGLIKGDAMLAAAVWRAIFKGDVNANVSDIALVTGYLRQELQRVDIISDADFVSGGFKFGDFGTVRRTLDEKSSAMGKAFGSADLAQLEAVQTEAAKEKR